MDRQLFPLVIVAGLSTVASADTPGHELNLSVSPAQVKILPVPAGRRFVSLPDLEYVFLLDPHCDDDWQPGAMALSVADSRLRIDPPGERTEPIEARLQIPAEQLAPLPVSGFCELDNPAATEPANETGPREKIVTAAFSAQASLLCTAGDDTRITYTARALNVSLLCDRKAISTGNLPADSPVRDRQR